MTRPNKIVPLNEPPHPGGVSPETFACLLELEKKVLWLSTWMIHHANHIRPSRDGLKVGGHQASSASLVTLMTALYFHVLRPSDRVAVKPHASPVYHAIQYLMGRQSLDQLENFRAFGGAQSYPSRTKDADEVDFSTGSVGLGVAVTLFASLVQDYLMARDMLPPGKEPGRMAFTSFFDISRGVRAPGTSTVLITRSAFVTSSSMFARLDMIVVTCPCIAS